MQSDIWYERYRKKYAFLNYHLEIVIRRKLAKILSIIKGMKLDVGCGRAIISDHIDKDDMVITSDLSKNNVKFAKQKYTHIYNFMVCDAKALPFREKSFEVVFSQGLYEHFNSDDIKTLLKESSRVCNITLIGVPLEGWKLFFAVPFLPYQS